MRWSGKGRDCFLFVLFGSWHQRAFLLFIGIVIVRRLVHAALLQHLLVYIAAWRRASKPPHHHPCMLLCPLYRAHYCSRLWCGGDHVQAGGKHAPSPKPSASQHCLPHPAFFTCPTCLYVFALDHYRSLPRPICQSQRAARRIQSAQYSAQDFEVYRSRTRVQVTIKRPDITTLSASAFRQRIY